MYKTYTRETNDLLKLTSFRMSSHVNLYTVSDEIRRWSSLSEDECQLCVSDEDGVLNDVTITDPLPLTFCFSRRLCVTSVTVSK